MLRILDHEAWGGEASAVAEHFRICWQHEVDHSENESFKAFIHTLLKSIRDDSLEEWIKYKGSTLLVAVDEGEGSGDSLVGTLLFGPLSTDWSDVGDMSTITYFWGLYIHPDYRRQGIGHQLIGYMEKRLSSEQCICALVDASNKPLLRFYQHNHYHERAPDPQWQTMVDQAEQAVGLPFVIVEKALRST